jgi:hypothetical protein
VGRLCHNNTDLWFVCSEPGGKWLKWVWQPFLRTVCLCLLCLNQYGFVLLRSRKMIGRTTTYLVFKVILKYGICYNITCGYFLFLCVRLHFICTNTHVRLCVMCMTCNHVIAAFGSDDVFFVCTNCCSFLMILSTPRSAV